MVVSADPSSQGGCLYLVGTPIGHLEDITYRAVRILGEADRILAEDTRRARILLDRYAISKPITSFHEHNELSRLEALLDRMRAGERLALITDAGSPGISDPGYRLARACLDAGLRLSVVPGPSACVTALQLSGLPTDSYLFVGFPPRKSVARRKELAQLKPLACSLVFYESPHRVGAFLADAVEELGDRRAAVCRELTKMHEEVARGTLPELARTFADREVRGEITVVVEGRTRARVREEESGE